MHPSFVYINRELRLPYTTDLRPPASIGSHVRNKEDWIARNMTITIVAINILTIYEYTHILNECTHGLLYDIEEGYKI